MEEKNLYWPQINEVGSASAVPRQRMDELWAQGWRHFGPRFFRYSLMWQDDEWKRVVSLRVPLSDWSPSKSQRRTLRKNEDLEVQISGANPNEEACVLFEAHKQRFRSNVPDDLSDFLGDAPNGCPGPCLQVEVKSEGRLLAVSYLDLGVTSCSSIYGVFEPEESSRRLGIFTMLQEMLYAKEAEMDYYYLGYACIENSPYDYKKEVGPQEIWNWSQWQPFRRDDYSKQALPIEVKLLE